MAKRRVGPRWIVSNLTDVAKFFGVSYSTVKTDWRARGMPGRSGKYDLSAIARWRTKRRQQTGAPAPRADWDEKLKRERARITRMRRREMQRHLLRRDDVHAGLVAIASLIRSAGERLQKLYGGDAQEVLDETLDEAAAEIDRLFGGGGAR